MRPRPVAKDPFGTVKDILSICVSVGCAVSGKDPKKLQQEIADGGVEVPENRDPKDVEASMDGYGMTRRRRRIFSQG